VVDGGSNDGTLAIVEEFVKNDARVLLIRNVNDCGPAHARAEGIKNASGNYIAFLDADDLWLPEKLMLQIGFMENNGYSFSYTSYRKMSADGKFATCALGTYRSFNFLSGLARRGIGSPTVIIQRYLFDQSVLKIVGKSHGEETLWWLVILRKGVKAYGLMQPLALYRDTPHSLSKKIIRNQSTVWHSYRNELNVPLLLSLVTYSIYILDVIIRRVRLSFCTFFKGRVLVENLLRVDQGSLK
jgi:teichuronic acid biosynthesis glycosyltransferase TuaG